MLTWRPRYDQIRDLYTHQLASVWMEDTTDTTRASIDKKIDSFVRGELVHAEEMLSTLWEVMGQPGDITALSNFLPARFVSPSPSLVSHGDAHPTPQVKSGSHEPRKLGSCEDRPHQVNPRRGFLRQEVLG